MICPHCGSNIADGSKFCTVCGTRLVEEAAAPQEQPQEQDQPTQAQAQPTQAQAQPTPVNPPMPTSVIPGPQYVQRGCLGQAWSDITSSPDWVKRVLLLMIMKPIPVVGLFADGYNLKWGAAAAKGDQGPLPKGAFGTPEVKAGLFFAVLGILEAAALASLWYLLVIPVIGWILFAVIGLIFGAVMEIGAIRMAMFDKFGAAFELSDCIAAFKRRPGALIAATIVPGLVVGLILFVLALMFGAAGAGAMSVGFGRAGSYGSALALGNPARVLAGMLTGLGFLAVLLVVLSGFLSGFASLWSLRAVGIWVNRNAPEWMRGEKVTDTVFSNAPVAPFTTNSGVEGQPPVTPMR